jgi:hypothetical protein
LVQWVVLWVLGSVVGAVVLARPDDDDARVVSLSEDHGPSPVDLAGIAVLAVVWLPVVAALWTRRHRLGARARARAAALAAVGTAVLIVTIALDLGAGWLAGVALILAAHVVALRAAFAAGGQVG